MLVVDAFKPSSMIQHAMSEVTSGYSDRAGCVKFKDLKGE
jgi:hypothetical protein